MSERPTSAHGFISRVRRRQRSFTLDHLVKLEQVTGRALPVILLEATDPGSVPAALRPIHAGFRHLFMSNAARDARLSDKTQEPQ